MKKSFNHLYDRIGIIKLGLLIISFISFYEVSAQEKQSVTGKLIDGNNNEAVPYATVALIRATDSAITGGALSNENGVFSISPVTSGLYRLLVSNIGYKPVTINIEIINSGVTDAGTIILQDTAILLKELIIVGDRIKAKSERDKTVYTVTEKIQNVSNTGTDVLRLIPGIQIDLMQNISLEGSREIRIFVDGKERDKSFLGQLNPKQIDNVEIISVPSSGYDGNITGAINIILKKDRDAGINGQILAEIPTSFSEVYIFPTYSLSYGFKKINLYTSYNGEMTYLDQQENTARETWNNNDTIKITTIQYVKQKNRSNRFHYGFDYFLTDHDQFNFYAFYNPYSQELDGTAESKISGKITEQWHALKEDADKNSSSFYSLFYKHIFNNGSNLTSDISSYYLRAENRTDYIQQGRGNDPVLLSNAVKPGQNILSIKTDYSTLILKKLNFSTGLKIRLQKAEDRLNDFKYTENILAGYGNIACVFGKIDLSTGLRVEKSVVTHVDSLTNHALAFLPYANFKYKLSSKQNIRLSFNNSIRRPNIYQLNPSVTMSDPYSVSSGNPYLRQALLSTIFLEHSVQFNSNYFATRLFWNRTPDAINNLTFINDECKFETQIHNLGTLSQYGLQFSGSFRISFLTLNPYAKVFQLCTTGNDLARQYSIGDKNRAGLESGLSVIASFRHELSFSATLQYNSPNYDIQARTFSDLSYFLSLEKTIKQKFKIGIASAIPFTGSFTYQGSEINGTDFHSRYEGKVELSLIPVWFKLGWQFSSGKKRDKIERSREEIESLKKKVF